ncbi:hypothetical protein H6P81_020775 [Aristolochia fimbriata]|uniref:Uncharacterized protein n=1 Tax=Aristolochia fimbriata TaxID=158543 RepID=A0AAV7DVE6_ARIFI|nr:hypothetical protein H6P81_020775 [Aristolochia fimbriata]
MWTKKAPSSLTLFFLLLLLLLLLLLSFNIVSSSCEASDHQNNSAVSYSAVTSLPGLQGPLPFYLETGYVGVGESSRDQVFYYFVESERNPDEDPLVLWLDGGPGCSALCGLVYEIGPFQFKDAKYEGSLQPALHLNPYSWTKVSNIIFTDQPVGTGFSYSIGTADYNNSDTKSVKQLHEFLRKWLLAHPRFMSNPLYVGGVSYAGKIVPILALEIINGNDDAGHKSFLNFKGYFVGNPVTGSQVDIKSRVPFAHGMGLISDELYESAKMNCEGVHVEPKTEKCAEDLQQVETLVGDLEEEHILYSRCPYDINAISGGRRILSGVQTLLGMPISECLNYVHLLSKYWANNEVVKDALHVRKGTTTEWKRCKREMPYIHDIPQSLEYHAKVTSSGYRALIFSGDHDLLVSHVGTQAWIRSLNYSISVDWHPWYADGQVGGYTRTYSNNLTFATVKGAGHVAPQHKPKECLPMFRKWISGSPL